MPTSYTAGILDGTITDFKGFASTCMRAFGATMHMRDEALDKEYEPREPSDYHLNQIQHYKKEIELAESRTEEEYLISEKILMKDELKRMEDSIFEKKKQLEKLEKMLDEARNWNPPSREHQEFKSFMMDQLSQTIQFDADVEYYEKKRGELLDRFGKIPDGKKIKEKTLNSLRDNLAYYTKSHQEELERCEKSNKWVKDVFDSI